MFKNLYTPGEYSIKETPYKLRGSFLSKADKLGKEKQEKPKDVPPEVKLAALSEELKTIEAAIASKRDELLQLEQSNEDLKLRTELEIKQRLDEAHTQAEELKALKQKEGFDSGFEKGYYEGLEKSKAETDQKYSAVIATLQSIAGTALTEKHKIVKSAEDDMINLSVDVAKKVVGQELTSNREIVVNFVKEAIKMLENKEKITLYANPEDIELIKSHREDFKKLIDLNDALHILPDDILDRGECRLESDSEIVDTDINFQFSEIKNKLHSAE